MFFPCELSQVAAATDSSSYPLSLQREIDAFLLENADDGIKAEEEEEDEHAPSDEVEEQPAKRVKRE